MLAAPGGAGQTWPIMLQNGQMMQGMMPGMQGGMMRPMMMGGKGMGGMGPMGGKGGPMGGKGAPMQYGHEPRNPAVLAKWTWRPREPMFPSVTALNPGKIYVISPVVQARHQRRVEIER